MLCALALSGFRVETFEAQRDIPLPPNQGPHGRGAVRDLSLVGRETPPANFSATRAQAGKANTGGGGGDTTPTTPPNGNGKEGAGGQSRPLPPQPQLVNVIKNGDFEKPWHPRKGIADDWNIYDNGRAHFGWYDEQWLEAVHNGKHAQLMEIKEVDTNAPNRVMAIYQTVTVEPNSVYELSFYAILRSDEPEGARNQGYYQLHWGVDPWGHEWYDNVTEWREVELEEQSRLGSEGPAHDRLRLRYTHITQTIQTGDSNKITLYIRAQKEIPNEMELNYDIDDVSLTGPYLTPEQLRARLLQSQPVTPTESMTDTPIIPGAGGVLPGSPIGGRFFAGLLLLMVLGAAGAASSLRKDLSNLRKD
jgi:hypothetical protein